MHLAPFALENVSSMCQNVWPIELLRWKLARVTKYESNESRHFFTERKMHLVMRMKDVDKDFTLNLPFEIQICTCIGQFKVRSEVKVIDMILGRTSGPVWKLARLPCPRLQWNETGGPNFSVCTLWPVCCVSLVAITRLCRPKLHRN